MLYARYQETLRAYQAMDFDDLIRLPVDLFQQHPEALLRWHQLHQRRARALALVGYEDEDD